MLQTDVIICIGIEFISLIYFIYFKLAGMQAFGIYS